MDTENIIFKLNHIMPVLCTVFNGDLICKLFLPEIYQVFFNKMGDDISFLQQNWIFSLIKGELAFSSKIELYISFFKVPKITKTHVTNTEIFFDELNLTKEEQKIYMYNLFFTRAHYSDNFLFLNKDDKIDIKDINDFNYEDFIINQDLSYMSQILRNDLFVRLISANNFFYLHEDNKKDLIKSMKQLKKLFDLIDVRPKYRTNLASVAKIALSYERVIQKQIQGNNLNFIIKNSQYKLYSYIINDLNKEIE